MALYLKFNHASPLKWDNYMITELQDIKSLLTESVTGVVFLGALGSIVGSITIFLLKTIVKHVNASKEKWLLRICYYLFGKSIEIGTKVRFSLGPKNNDIQFVIYHINEAIWCMIVSLAFFSTITITALTSIHYGIERPVLLSTFIALNIISFIYLLKNIMQLISYSSEELEEKVSEIEKLSPKKFPEWYREDSE